MQLPAVSLSRRDLEARGARFLPPNARPATALPILGSGATFSMAQDARWLDVDHFAGRSVGWFARRVPVQRGSYVRTAHQDGREPVVDRRTDDHALRWVSHSIRAREGD